MSLCDGWVGVSLEGSLARVLRESGEVRLECGVGPDVRHNGARGWRRIFS